MILKESILKIASNLIIELIGGPAQDITSADDRELEESERERKRQQVAREYGDYSESLDGNASMPVCPKCYFKWIRYGTAKPTERIIPVSRPTVSPPKEDHFRCPHCKEGYVVTTG